MAPSKFHENNQQAVPDVALHSGTGPVASLPTGNVTFLYTDIEGSTERWERAPVAMREALVRHHAILRTAINEHGGVVYQIIGDAFVAVFAAAPAALHAALQAQRALLAEPWDIAVAPLRVRMAIHHGQGHYQNDGYHAEESLNRLFRLLSASYGGQIVLTSDVHALLDGIWPPDVQARDLGLHRLRDLTTRLHVWQVIAPDLPTDFPPLRSLSHHPNNLPSKTTELYGRAEEIAAIAARLREPQTRQLTLTGLGGIGKTRLGLAVAAELLPDFPDGVYFVPLDLVQEATQVATALATTLGVRDASEQPLPELLARWLQPKRLLLLFDNCEHVTEAAPLVVDLLRAAPNLKVLATSRVPVGVYGEQEHAVPPLPLPPAETSVDLAMLEQNAAVKLFIARAQAVAPRFRLNTSNATAVAEICVRLEGLPLAIELAAARVRALSPAQILARLGDRLDFLQAQSRDGPERQQTLRATLEWSYALLPPQEQKLLACLSVFAGGASLEAISAVWQPDETQPLDVVEGLIELVSHSLVQAQTDDEMPRYSLLETVREYGRERLLALHTAHLVQHTHAEFFLSVAEEISAQWGTPSFEQRIGQLQREYDNVRAGFAWVCVNDYGLALRFAEALWQFWRSYGYISEGRAWLKQLLEVVAATAEQHRLEMQYRAMHAAAWLASDQHDYAEANRLFEASSALRKTPEQTSIDPDMLLNAARQARSEGDYGRAARLLEQALVWHRAQGHSIPKGNMPLDAAQQAFGQTLREFGLLTREQGNFARARGIFEESLAFHDAVGDRACVALAMIGLADIGRDQGDGEEVQEYGEQALVILRELGMPWAIGFTLNTLALGAYYHGDVTRAAVLIRESEAIFRDLQSDGSLTEILITVGKIEWSRGNMAAAYAAMAEALRLALAVGPRLFVAASLEGLGVITAAQGRAEVSMRSLALATTLRQHMGAPVWPAEQARVNAASTANLSRLGDQAFSEIWSWAQADPLESIITTIPTYILPSDG